MKHKGIFLSAIIGTPILLVAALYAGLSLYYSHEFIYGTWVNGIYCTGKDVDVINQELVAKSNYHEINIITKDQQQFTWELSDVNYQISSADPLERLLKTQKPWLWVRSLLGEANILTIQPSGSIDEAAYERKFRQLSIVKDRKPDEQCRVYIQKTEEGYQMIDERSSVLDVEVFKQALRDAILTGEDRLYLDDAGCYKTLPLDESMQETISTYQKVNGFQDCHIVYHFGDKEEVVDPSVTCEWISLDEQGEFALDEKQNLILDEKKVDEYIDALADKYDTVGKQRKFLSTRGDIITVEGGTYGNKLDKKAEQEYLLDAFKHNRHEEHEPAYLVQMGRDSADLDSPKDNDIGNTYIEVDMSQQHMYYYQNGQLRLDTPVVTGNTSLRRGTPSGVNFIYAKEKNRILRGQGYASHVNFWMPVKGGVGIHDASWRSKYGGKIYQTAGSHGCINTPYDKMKSLYEMATIGTPVVMFY